MDAPTPRACGGCEACCTTLRVDALGKPPGQRCPAQTGSGCGRYTTRPPICGGFVCNWLMADPALPADARPDRCGVLVWVGPTAAGLTVHVHELEPGALGRPPFPRIVGKWRQRLAVHRTRADGSHQLGVIDQPWVDA